MSKMRRAVHRGVDHFKGIFSHSKNRFCRLITSSQPWTFSLYDSLLISIAFTLKKYAKDHVRKERS